MTTPAAPSTPSADTQSLTLPCGRSAVVQAFNGNAQRILGEMHEAITSKTSAGDDVIERLLMEVTRELSDARGDLKRSRSSDLLALPTGSRHRLLVASRVLSYGPDVKIDHVCMECRKSTPETFDLSRAVDVPYPEGVKAVRFESGGKVFAIGYGTGETARRFAQGKRQQLWGMYDEPLARVVSVDGKTMGPQQMLRLSGGVLDPVRRAGRAMVPVVLLPEVVEAREVEESVRTQGDQEAQEGQDAPSLPGPSDLITDPSQMPAAGLSERVQIRCQHCGHLGVSSFVSAEDFLLRGTLEALND